MSRQIALANIRLQSAPRWAHTEYSLRYHERYFGERTGLRRDDERFARAINDLWLIDFNWRTDDGLRKSWGDWGRATDMGHAVYASDGSDRREPKSSPFQTPEEVWGFDAVREYGLPDFEEQVRAYEAQTRDSREAFPEQLTTGGYYKSIVSGAIAAFGWDMLLLGASDALRMEPVFDSFFRRTLFHMQAWAETSAEVIIQHDDFVWSSGPFMHPDLYRKIIIPRYAELWKPLHRAGKIVLFCSDGDFTEFATDIAEAGADGMIFEPMMDFGYMVDTFGSSKCLVGSFVDCRDMAFGTWDTVRRSIDRTVSALEPAKGAIVAVGNHLPPNIPADMMDRYRDYLLEALKR